VRRAQEDIMAPTPAFVRANELQRALVEEIEHQIRGLGALDVNGAIVVIDGLDALAPSEQSDLMRQCEQLSNRPKVRVVTAARRSPASFGGSLHVQEPLSNDATGKLISRVVEYHLSYDAAVADIPESAKAAVRWPLFAILLARRIMENRFSETASRSEFLEQMVDAALGADADALASNERLTTLAVALVDRDVETIPARELGTVTGLASLKRIPIVVSDGQNVGLAHRFFADFLAAKALLAGDAD